MPCSGPATPPSAQVDALGPMKAQGSLAVAGVIPRLGKIALCAVGPVVWEQPFSYKVVVQVVPADPEPERESELEGTGHARAAAPNRPGEPTGIRG